MERLLRTLWLAAAAVLCLSSCEMMHEDEADCSTRLRIRLVYDRNMAFADAFAAEVGTVWLHAYDAEGRLAYSKSESGEAIAQRGGYMDVGDIAPGVYNLTVWAEGEQRHDSTYAYGSAAQRSSLTSLLRREGRTVGHDLTPLFHGQAEAQDLTLMERGGVRKATVSLTKNTNTVRVVLQHTSGKDVDASQFAFTIDDNNTFLASDNSRLETDSVTYQAWSITSATAGVASDGSQGQTQVAAAVAELTVSRLFADAAPRLTVRNTTTGRTVLSIPLIEYVLLVKGKYNRDMDTQEYLDRQDEYNMTFFLDDAGNWLSSTIIINSWRIVRSEGAFSY